MRIEVGPMGVVVIAAAAYVTDARAEKPVEVSFQCAKAIATALQKFEQTKTDETPAMGKVSCEVHSDEVVVKLAPKDPRVRGGGIDYHVSLDGKFLIRIRGER
jgi:hypothetical protein